MASFDIHERNEEPCALSTDKSGSECSVDMDLKEVAPTLTLSSIRNQLPPHAHSALFPPFYNRPPTPLPPSPSLTSLLRPSFSSANSHITTPESSDVEASQSTGHTSKAAGVPAPIAPNLATSAQYAPTVPRASPKVPTYEYYGFALYLGSSAAFLIYILWAYLPAPLLHQMGIQYYPDRWWALGLPCWLAVLVLYIYVALASYNTRYLTLPLYSCENLVDECAQVAVVDHRTGHIVRETMQLTSDSIKETKDVNLQTSMPRASSISLSAFQLHDSSDANWSAFWSTGTDAVMDVPVGGVCELLYGRED